jgi:hypothetical protein
MFAQRLAGHSAARITRALNDGLPYAAAAANQLAVGRRVPGSVTPAEMAALLTV